MKPDVVNAMLQLIALIRTTFPFDRAEAQICAGPCQGCSLKLLGFLESELDSWEARIDAGEQVGLVDLSQLIRTSRKIGRVLEKAGLVQMSLTPSLSHKQKKKSRMPPGSGEPCNPVPSPPGRGLG